MELEESVLLDTNILIYVLNGQLDPTLAIKANVFYISSVTVMELYALAGMSKREQNQIDQLLEGVIVVDVDKNIGRTAGLLARTRRKAKPDLIIAATAVELGIPLLTRNVKDFKNIPGVRVRSLNT